MKTVCHYISYSNTNSFSKLAIDYIEGNKKLLPFYTHPVSLQSIQDAIENRKHVTYNRTLLVSEFKKQYAAYDLSEKQMLHLEALLKPNTFTITTAHQPNIFTGHLYFIYKILHAIKLADELGKSLPDYHFVPVYYMGSEDADLDELGHIWLEGEKVEWQTQQSGAVGRMNTKGLEKIIERLQGEFGDLPFGDEMINLCRKAYLGFDNIQQATLFLVNELFKNYGLLILIPDNAQLKKEFEPVVKKELVEQFSHSIVQKTNSKLSEHYKVQAGGREINLFYLSDAGQRERIELSIPNKDAENYKYEVRNLGLEFSKNEILQELENHPERFSANVILRGVFQEMILPNLVFIGGGGEIAYWLELKDVFAAAQIPFPMLVLRNSFLLKNHKAKELQNKLGINEAELFLKEQDAMNFITLQNSAIKLDTNDEQKQVYAVYEKLQEQALEIDVTLKPHIAALHTKTLQGLMKLETKLLRAARRKEVEKARQLTKLKGLLFPNNNLQERVDNFMPLYAKYGSKLIEAIYVNSLTLEQQFGILEMGE